MTLLYLAPVGSVQCYLMIVDPVQVNNPYLGCLLSTIVSSTTLFSIV